MMVNSVNCSLSCDMSRRHAQNQASSNGMNTRACSMTGSTAQHSVIELLLGDPVFSVHLSRREDVQYQFGH